MGSDQSGNEDVAKIKRLSRKTEYRIKNKTLNQNIYLCLMLCVDGKD